MLLLSVTHVKLFWLDCIVFAGLHDLHDKKTYDCMLKQIMREYIEIFLIESLWCIFFFQCDLSLIWKWLWILNMKYLFTFFLDLETVHIVAFIQQLLFGLVTRLYLRTAVEMLILLKCVFNMLHSVMWNNNKYIHRVIYLIFV